MRPNAYFVDLGEPPPQRSLWDQIVYAHGMILHDPAALASVLDQLRLDGPHWQARHP